MLRVWRRWWARWTVRAGLLGLLSLGGAPLPVRRLPDLPPQDGRPNPGVAGAFAGVSGGMLLLAGGANFPAGYPWEGGAKVWHATLYALRLASPAEGWQVVGSLPAARGYGGSARWRNQLLMVGGNDARQPYADVWTVRWEADRGTVRVDTLPSLPVPLANLSAVCWRDRLYAFGGESERGAVGSLYGLNLRNVDAGWQRLPDLPGPARAYSAMTAAAGRLYVLGGRYTEAGRTRVLTDAYAFRIQTNRWERLPDLPGPLSAGSAVATGGEVWTVGGDTGERLVQIEALNNRLRDLRPGPECDRLTADRNALQRDHPGFARAVWAYDPEQRRWLRRADLPFAVPVTTPVVAVPDGFILPSGEVSPGVRTPASWRITTGAYPEK